MILLDTHAMIWWCNGDSQLSPTAAKTISEAVSAGQDICISAISAWELGMLVKKNRLALNRPVEDWINTVSAIDQVRFIPITPDIAVASTQLPGDFHKDPADRMIVATARNLGCPVVSADKQIINYDHVETIW